MIIKTYFDGQLMYASIKIMYRGIYKVIDKLAVDTGAAYLKSHSVYNPNVIRYTWLSLTGICYPKVLERESEPVTRIDITISTF